MLLELFYQYHCHYDKFDAWKASIKFGAHWVRVQITQSGHCVKSVRIPRYSGPCFPAFWLNTERYGVASLRIQSECGKIRIRITPNKDTFDAVGVFPELPTRVTSLNCLLHMLGKMKL